VRTIDVRASHRNPSANASRQIINTTVIDAILSWKTGGGNGSSAVAKKSQCLGDDALKREEDKNLEVEQKVEFA